ncbi:MAG: hypothetical protein S0880_02395 [Actinomycetota bacterium]|nr:hypothetical protein [Actinomycetota bacterium]
MKVAASVWMTTSGSGRLPSFGAVKAPETTETTETPETSMADTVPLEPSPRATSVVEVAEPENPPGRYAELNDNLWRLAIGGLRHHGRTDPTNFEISC